MNRNDYQQLCRRVLERDGWRCQQCGKRRNLQVHHQLFRSHGGPDAIENLITLCGSCHAQLHEAGVRIKT